MNARASRLIVILSLSILAATSAFAQDNAPAAPVNLRVTASGGFAGWAIPLPDFAARIIVRGETTDASSRLVYSDISLTPLRISIRGNTSEAECVVTIRNRATTLRMPASAAFILEPGATLLVDESVGVTASLQEKHEIRVPAGGGEYWLPLLLYPGPPDSIQSAVEVEAVVGASNPVRTTASFNYLPRGRIYGLLIEPQARGMLPPDELPSSQLRSSETRSASGYNQQFQLLSCGPKDIGPDFRVLRHFSHIFVSADYWKLLPERVRQIIVDAAGMGGRLIIFSAKQPVQVGALSFQPRASSGMQPFGFGEALVTSLAMEDVKPQTMQGLAKRVEWAHSLAMGYTNEEEVGLEAARDIKLRNEMNEALSYAWMISLSDILPGKRSVNPFWAYEYLTRAGMMHPMDKPEYHWQGVGLKDASRELVDVTTFARRDWAPVHGGIDNSLRRASASSLTRAAIWFTLLVIAVAAVCFLRRCGNVALASSMLILSGIAVGAFALRIDTLLPGAVKAVVISTTIGNAQSDITETRSVIYTYSPYATGRSLQMQSEGAVLSRISPLESGNVSVASLENGQFALEQLHIEPLLPTEVSISEVRRGDNPVECELAPAPGGEQGLKVICGSEPVELLCIVNGTRLLFLGSASPSETRTVVLPAGEIAPTANDPKLAMDVARSALSDYQMRNYRRRYSRNPDALKLVAANSLAETMREEVLRGLIAEGRGITLVGIRQKTVSLELGGEVSGVPRSDLFIYRLR